jgi:hypothetical protein
MEKRAFHIEIIIKEGRKKLDEDSLRIVLKKWIRSQKEQVFESDGAKVKVSKVKAVRLIHEKLEDIGGLQGNNPASPLAGHKVPYGLRE